MPADADPSSGYRRYQTAQVPSAHLVKRLRDLDMPLPSIRDVLAAPDLAGRDRAISEHLTRMESTLARAQETVAALRSLLTHAPEPAIERRVLPATPVAIAREVVAWDDVEDWLARTLASLDQRVQATGPDGAVYGPRFFEEHIGEVAAFVPVTSSGDVLTGGRFAAAVHDGAFDRLDETYGALGSYVTTLDIDIDAGAAIREHYLDSSTTEVVTRIGSSHRGALHDDGALRAQRDRPGR